MNGDQLFSQFVDGFPARRFTAGLLVAFIDLYLELGVPGSGFDSLESVLAANPRQLTTSAGRRANTLIVKRPDGSTLSLRPFYNAAESYYRAEHSRFDYPSCAPHATQAWGDYTAWLDALATFDEASLRELRERVNKFVLENLKSQAFDPASVKVEPPLFRLWLEEFDMKSSGKSEPSGASFQGGVFGFLRADNPHLQVEVDKVRTGSKRLQRVGDIDCWEGSRLAISAEVKQFDLKPDDVRDLTAFANATGQRGTLGLVVALGFLEGVRAALEGLGLRTLDRVDMVRIVELWDPLKQRTAVASLVYYARHVEKNASLGDRIDAFLAEKVGGVASE